MDMKYRDAARAIDPGRKARQYALDRPRGIKTAAWHIMDLPMEVWAVVIRAKEHRLKTKHNKHLRFSQRLPRHMKRRLSRKYPRSAAHRVRKLKAL